MEPQPGSSQESDFLSPKKKRPRGAFSRNEKTMIVNVYKGIIENWPQSEDWSSTDCAKKTSVLTGVSLASVYNVLKQYKLKKDFEKPKKTGPRLSFKDKIDEFTFAAIRRKVHQFFFRNEMPTIKKVHQELCDDDSIPKMSKSMVRNILKHLNFKYASRKRRSGLIDRHDILLWRQRYLQQIKQYRREGKMIYYQDETWVNEGHTVNKTWVDTKVLSSRQAFLEGLTTGLKAPTGKGRRLIISHIGSEEGFVDEGLLVFEAKKGTDDYHKEMTAEVFEEWFRGILPKLKPNSVVVIDNAPYHSRKLEKTPTTAWLKANIQAWLSSKNIRYDETLTKSLLLEIVKGEKSKYNKCCVDEMAAEKGITVLRLPPYHCELNPIELIWAQIKGHVAKNNKTFKMAEVKELLLEGVNNITETEWQGCISHTIKEEDKFCNLDHLIDGVCDKFIIHVGESDDSDSSMPEEDSEDTE